MDEQFGRRATELRFAWGELGPRTKVPTWARQLYPDLDLESPEGKRRVRAIYNLELGHRPQGGEKSLKALFAALDPTGAAVGRIAAWVWFGAGEMPRPGMRVPGGAIVPDVSAPSSPAQPSTRGVLAPAMPVNLFMRVARVVRREGKRALDEEQNGRGDLDSLEVATAFEKWLRSLPEEQRAQLSSGFTDEDPGSNLL